MEDARAELLGLRRELEEARLRLRYTEPLAQLAVLTTARFVEINNPLAFLMANLAYVREELASARRSPAGAATRSSAELGEALTEALAGALRIRDIVGAIRDMTSDDPSETDALDIHPLLDAALRVTQQAHRPVRVLYLPCYEACARVRAPRGPLARAFFHAIHTVFDAQAGADSARKVRVRTRDEEGSVILELGGELSTGGLSAAELDAVRGGANASLARQHLFTLGGRLEFPAGLPEGYLLRARLPAAAAQLPA